MKQQLMLPNLIKNSNDKIILGTTVRPKVFGP